MIGILSIAFLAAATIMALAGQQQNSVGAFTFAVVLAIYIIVFECLKFLSRGKHD